MTTTRENEAFEAMLTHHRHLEDAVSTQVARLARDVAAGTSFEPAVAELSGFVTSSVLPHALAEEETIYQVAGKIPALRETVDEMVDEHRRIASINDLLAGATTGEKVGELAGELASLFLAHVAKENELLLPPLLADPKVDLAALLGQMQHLTEVTSGGRPAEVSRGEPELDVREIAPAKRHETIFATYQALDHGESFILVNDHDPKPLRYQFEAEHPGEFSWEYLESGPLRWRVQIGRAATEQAAAP